MTASSKGIGSGSGRTGPRIHNTVRGSTGPGTGVLSVRPPFFVSLPGHDFGLYLLVDTLQVSPPRTPSYYFVALVQGPWAGPLVLCAHVEGQDDD